MMIMMAIASRLVHGKRTEAGDSEGRMWGLSYILDAILLVVVVAKI